MIWVYLFILLCLVLFIGKSGNGLLSFGLCLLLILAMCARVGV